MHQTQVDYLVVHTLHIYPAKALYQADSLMYGTFSTPTLNKIDTIKGNSYEQPCVCNVSSSPSRSIPCACTHKPKQKNTACKLGCLLRTWSCLPANREHSQWTSNFFSCTHLSTTAKARCAKPFAAIFKCTYGTFCPGNMCCESSQDALLSLMQIANKGWRYYKCGRLCIPLNLLKFKQLTEVKLCVSNFSASKQHT